MWSPAPDGISVCAEAGEKDYLDAASDEKGGVLVAAFEQFGIPIKYVGVGEKQDDLIEFDPKQFAEALVGNDE